MQTFLPYADFKESARVLDYRRLGKQRLEAKQIILTLFHGGGWARHPATQMWVGKERALCHYGLAVCDEWTARGYSDYLRKFFVDVLSGCETGPYDLPWWFGDLDFHWSHQSNLLRKYPEHYSKFWPERSAAMPYLWPSPVPGVYRGNEPKTAVYRPRGRALRRGAGTRVQGQK